MIDVNQLRRGVSFEYEGNLYKVTEYSHRQPGRGKATIRVKVCDLHTGSNLELTFTSGQQVQNIHLEKRSYQYLYDDGQFYVFMDIETFEHKLVPHSIIDGQKSFLHDNVELDLLAYNGEIIDYELPKTLEFEVVEVEQAIAGDTATGATTMVTTESGLRVRTPLFIKVGDRIRVNTESGEYITRV